MLCNSHAAYTEINTSSAIGDEVLIRSESKEQASKLKNLMIKSDCLLAKSYNHPVQPLCESKYIFLNIAMLEEEYSATILDFVSNLYFEPTLQMV